MRTLLRQLSFLLVLGWGFALDVKAATREPAPGAAVPGEAAPYLANEVVVKLRPASGRLLRISRSLTGKISTALPSLDAALADAGADQMIQNPHSGTGRTKRQMSPEAARLRQALGHRVKVRLKPGTDMAAALSKLSQNPHVEYAEPNFLHTTSTIPPNDTYYATYQWNLNNTAQTITIPGNPAFTGTANMDIDAPEAWAITQGSPGIVVAVIDTGVDWDHPDLAANIWTNPGEIAGNGIDDDGNGFIDDVRGWDFVSVAASDVAVGEDPGPPDNNPMDFQGHGTHVSGIIAAVADNARGVAGVASLCKIMALRAGFKAANGSGALTEEDIADAIVYATDNGANVINMSFGGGFSTAISDAVAYSIAAGVVLVAASGNDNSSTPKYPAAYPSVISVAAVDYNGNRASFSNFGWWVDVSAPGVSILSTIYNDGYSWSSGTSMAAPHVAGVAALVWSDRPTLTASEVRSQVILTAKDLGATAWDMYTGYGLVNARKALGNHAPTLATLQAGSTLENQVYGPISLQVGDIDSGASSLVLTGQSSNPALVPVGNLSFGGSGSTRTLTVTPVDHQSGTTLITVTATDPGVDGIAGNADDLFVSKSFELTVQSVNDAPTLNALADVSVPANAGAFNVHLSGISPGPLEQNQTLTLTATSSNPTLLPNPTVQYTPIDGTGELLISPNTNVAGSAVITVTATDDGSPPAAISRTFSVTVAVPSSELPTDAPLMPIHWALIMALAIAGLGGMNLRRSTS